MTMSLNYLETTLTGIINALTPIFGMVLSILILKTRAKYLDWLSLFIGFFGVFLIFLIKGVALKPSEIVGTLIFVISTICYSLTGILSTKYQKHTSPYIMAYTTLLTATAVCGILTFFIHPSSFHYVIDLKYFSIFVIFGMLSSGYGYVIFYYLVAQGGPVYALLTTFIMPIVTLLLGYFLLDEKVTADMLVGLLFIFTGIGLMNYQKRKEKLKRVTT